MPPRRLDRAALAEGARALARCDPDLGRLHARLGVPPMWGRQPGFAALVRIILEQQVSLDAARTLFRRLAAHAGAMTPAALHPLGVDGLRAFGLTRQKAAYCHGLATRILDGELALARVAAAPDEEGRAMLRAVPGIGPWSVDIYYLMALRRPDVWPQGDLALAVALREVKQLNALPDRDAQQAIAAAWAPWRSVAARLLWAHYLDARGKYATAQ
jgi:DNA-3-methyladenine glycosylase II